MNRPPEHCREWERRIALYAGTDTPGREQRDVELMCVDRHLVECAGCLEFAADLKRSLDLLVETHREPIAAAHYAAVRARILTELEQQRRVPRRWVWASGLAAGAVAMVLLVAPRAGRVPKPEAAANPSIAVAAPNPAVDPGIGPGIDRATGWNNIERALPARKHARTARAVKTRPMNRTPGADSDAEPLLVRLVTDDPDVVMYWIAN